jgi:hypothetical protein
LNRGLSARRIFSRTVRGCLADRPQTTCKTEIKIQSIERQTREELDELAKNNLGRGPSATSSRTIRPSPRNKNASSTKTTPTSNRWISYTVGRIDPKFWVDEKRHYVKLCPKSWNPKPIQSTGIANLVHSKHKPDFIQSSPNRAGFPAFEGQDHNQRCAKHPSMIPSKKSRAKRPRNDESSQARK